MMPLAVLPDLNAFINMGLRPFFAWFLNKYPLKESILLAFIELAGLGEGRGVELPSQNRKSKPTSSLPLLETHRCPHPCEWVGWDEEAPGPWHNIGKQTHGAGMPGIWPEETARTTTPPFLFVLLDVLLLCRGEKPGISAGFFLGKVSVYFLLGELTTYNSRVWDSFPLVPSITGFVGKRLSNSILSFHQPLKFHYYNSCLCSTLLPSFWILV